PAAPVLESWLPASLRVLLYDRFDCRDFHDERRTFTGHRREFQQTAMFLDDRLGDGEAEAGAATVELGGEKGLQHPVMDIFRHADTLVPDDDSHLTRTFIVASGQPDAAFPVRQGLAGVQQQVHDDLFELLAAPLDSGNVLIQIEMELFGMLYKMMMKDRHGRRDDPVNVHFAPLQ